MSPSSEPTSAPIPTVFRRAIDGVTGRPRRAVVAGAAVAVLVPLLIGVVAVGARAADDKAAAQPKAALTVQAVRPQRAAIAISVEATGNIAPWQEAIVGTEANGLRIADVRVNVGDVVKRGQVLATFAPETIEAGLAQVRAAVVEAEATLAEAAANAERARGLQATGALSDATIAQYQTAERTARARLDAQRATLRAQQLRIGQTQVVAPDAGVISSRTATVGAVLPAGQELFRLIRQGRLEWRAEVAAADLAQVRPGMAAIVVPAGGGEVRGTVRVLAPTIDAATRNGIVYVDLKEPGTARAGMFARGRFEVGSSAALTLPQTAVLLRDGFSYVFAIDAQSRVRQLKVETGRRSGDRVEVTAGLPGDARVALAGGGFLADGDLVRVVDTPPPVTPPTPPTSASGTRAAAPAASR